MTRKALVGSAILLLLLCLLPFYFAMNYAKEEDARINAGYLERRSRSEYVAKSFFTAMRLNHDSVFGIIDPSLRPRVENWLQTHDPIDCRYLSGQTSTFIGGDGIWNIDFYCDVARSDTIWNDLLFLYDYISDFGESYTFVIREIHVQQGANGEWKVIDFKEPREKRP